MRSGPVRLLAGTAAVAALALGGSGFAGLGRGAPHPVAHARAAATDTATFAGGCFWSMEKAFEHQPGVVSATSGYSGGAVTGPSYEDVETGRTGHAESVQVVFDPASTTYQKLLDVYWHNTDPISTNGQFCDHGPQYRTIVFTRGVAQRRMAEASKTAVQAHFNKPVTTQIVAAGPFYPAEDYHQDFAEKNPVRYAAYRAGCGRDARLRELWGDAAGGQH